MAAIMAAIFTHERLNRTIVISLAGALLGTILLVGVPASGAAGDRMIVGVLFALGHFLVTFDPASLAVFFPGLLFGLLQRRTGSVLAGTLFHASCNVLIDVLHRSAI